MVLITCQNVSFAYEGNVVVSGLNFKVNRGDYLCVVGGNGSGKSTLIKGLLHLKQPQRGSVMADGGLRASDIGYLPQQTGVQRDFPASVREVVLSGRLNRRGLRPFYSSTDRAAATENMSRLGIGALADRCYRELSGGQRQRVLLARALCAAQKILLLDEPAAGLDPVVTGELYHMIEWINREMGITVIMVSHDVGSAVRYAGHILHLQNEQIFFGTASDYLKTDIGAAFIEAAVRNGRSNLPKGGGRLD